MTIQPETATPDDEQYRTYSLMLYETLVSGKGLKGLLVTAKKIFNNPILIADTSFRVLAHIEQTDMDDALWRQIIDTGYYPSHYIKAITESDVLYNHVFGNGIPTILTDAGSPNRYLAKMIMVNGRPVGFSVCIEYERQISGLDEYLFDVFCRVVGTELRVDAAVNEYHAHGYEFFLSEMLSGRANPDFLEERIRQLGIKIKRNLFIFVAGFRDDKTGHRYQMEYFKAVLQQIIPSGYCVVYGNSLVMLISQDSGTALPDLQKAKIAEMLESSDMVGGISHRFRAIESMNIHYNQACEAIRLGSRLGEGGCIFDYDSVCCFHLLDVVRQFGDLRNFCNPRVFDIIEYDAEYGTSYTITAYEYLNANGLPMLAAKRMDIHRNTIDYRIKRLKELFDIDFSNNETVFSFTLSFRILRFLAEPPFSTGQKLS